MFFTEEWAFKAKNKLLSLAMYTVMTINIFKSKLTVDVSLVQIGSAV